MPDLALIDDNGQHLGHHVIITLHAVVAVGQ